MNRIAVGLILGPFLTGCASSVPAAMPSLVGWWEQIGVRTVTRDGTGRRLADQRHENAPSTVWLEFTAADSVHFVAPGLRHSPPTWYAYRPDSLRFRDRSGETVHPVLKLTRRRLVYRTHIRSSAGAEDVTFTYTRAAAAPPMPAPPAATPPDEEWARNLQPVPYDSSTRQPTPTSWPRNARTGSIEFTGVLPWPTTGATPAQQRVWARRWYAANLAEAKPDPKADTTFAGLDQWAYLDSVSYPGGVPRGEDSAYHFEIWRLLYKVDLVPTPAGLAYRLSTFQCGTMGFDNSSFEGLENALGQYSEPIAVFHRRLRKAITRW